MKHLGTAILVLLVGAGLMFAYFGIQRWANEGQSFSGAGGINAAKCAVTSVTQATIGHQLSSTLLAANERRAWATIELEQTTGGVATNTPSLSFDEGAAATLVGGVKLSTSTPKREFGRNADFAYTGAVTGITDVGSTTVRVTECTY